MELDVGFVCGSCDAFAPFSARECPSCGVALGFTTTEDTGAQRWVKPPTPRGGSALEGIFGDLVPNPSASFKRPDLGLPRAPAVSPAPEKIFVGPVKIPARFAVSEALMDQARSYVCKKCYSPVPQGHKFCGRCGEPVPREVLTAQTLLLSKMLEPGKAKLVVIKGEGFQADPSDETAFLLGGRHHPAGRTQGDILFDRDNWVSPLHATFYYRDDGKLMIRDEASLNGVFVRIKGTTTIQPGDVFLAGEQVFRVDTTPRASDGNDPDGTLFYSSPKRPSPFRLVQILRGGITATQVCAREASVSVGREGCDMNFPNDPYMSTRHCKVELTAGGAYQLTDTSSKNGTYLAIHGERELGHGDYLFIGRELLRVDISA
ncbi:MAG: FHA domain-containing protein [Polyangiales bacterium]